jgi:hypothetical protein
MNPHDLNTLNCQCENALIDKPFHDHMNTWLKEYENLFYSTEQIINSGNNKIGESINTVFIFSFYNEYKTTSIS